MAVIKAQTEKTLPPFKGDLQIIKIVKSGEALGTKPLGYVNDFENARGDFNDLAAGTEDFNSLANKSGEQFFTLTCR